uniref:Putative N-acetyltransferase n=1 Tax=termite gut metagenome TaxID=433724 RepID=S0DFK4_9ZZZZ
MVTRLTVTLREFEPDDAPTVTEAMLLSENYAVAMTGYFPEGGDLQSLFYVLPETADPNVKHLYTILADDTVAGLADTLIGWPDTTTVTIGLFLVHPRFQRMGVASQALEAGTVIARKMGLQTLRAACPRNWLPGEQFLAGHGFVQQVSSSTAPMNRITHPHEASHLVDAWVRGFRPLSDDAGSSQPGV